MYVDSHGNDTRGGKNMDLYMPRVIKDNYKRGFSYMATNLWNQLPTDVKESTTLDSFKQNYKYSKGWIKNVARLESANQTIDVLCTRICACVL